MEGTPSFGPEAEESDEKFRKLLNAHGFDGIAAESIIDRTRGDEASRQRWFDHYGYLLESEESEPKEDAEPAPEENAEEASSEA
jgi:hypothetical protein